MPAFWRLLRLESCGFPGHASDHVSRHIQALEVTKAAVSPQTDPTVS
jgi:hypothetical protein